MVIERTGNIFTSSAQTLVNTVNTVGVMGAGIAFEFSLRYREMYERYQHFCESGAIEIGKLWIYDAPGRKILNFPTKKHWKDPSEERYLHAGLQKFVTSYRDRGITSIAFPLLGSDKGGIAPDVSLRIMHQYLDPCDDVDSEIWHFDPLARDDLFDDFIALIADLDLAALASQTRIRRDILEKIIQSANRRDINSLSGLLRVQGVGKGSLEKLFDYVMNGADKGQLAFDFG